MKKNIRIYHLLTAIFLMFFCSAQSVKASESVTYYDGDLGAFYNQSQTTFKVWSSSASSVKVVIDGIDNEKCPLGVCSLVKDNNNVWMGYAPGDLLEKEYTYTVEYANGEKYEGVLDPFNRYINENGNKNIIYDDGLLSIENEVQDSSVLKIINKNKSIYGLDIVNFTKHNSWNGSEDNRGKLLALTEEGTKYNGVLTGYDHIKSLGITYVELSEIYDLNSPFSINKSITSGAYFYSGVMELKKVINDYKTQGIGIILTFDYKDFTSSFVTNLKHFDNSQYDFENNQLDVNNRMVQDLIKKILLDYVVFYEASGIKIENMADYSVEFINEVSELLTKDNEQIMMYGDGSYATLNENNAGENNLKSMNDIKMLNGSLNYALFGNLLDKDEKGILDGNYNKDIVETLKFALLSSVDNGQIDYSQIKGISYKNYWGNKSAYQLINYLGTSDGLTIFDKLFVNNLSSENIIKQKAVLAFSTMMISGGIPYIYSGNEFLISHLDITNNPTSICDELANFCFYTDNQYKLINWSYAQENESTTNAFISLLNYRKSINSVAQTDAKIIKNNVQIYTNDELNGVVGFSRNYPNAYVNDTEKVFVVINYSNNDYTITDVGGKGWRGMYKYNSSLRDGEDLIMKANSFYSEFKQKQPKINSWITLIIVIVVIGGIYYLNIILNKRLVEKNGYDVKDISRKYRIFVRNKRKQETDEENKEIENELSEESIEEESDNSENKNGN